MAFFASVRTGLTLLAVALLAWNAHRSAAEAAPVLRVAVFRADVTPPLGHPTYPSYKPLATIEQPLSAKGVVLDDGQRRYVLCAIDWCVIGHSTRSEFRRKAAVAAGTDPAYVTMHAVHQHTAPTIDLEAQDVIDKIPGAPPYLDRRFHEQAVDRLAAAVKEAVARLTPCDQLGAGQARVERVASSRRLLSAEGKLVNRMSSTPRRPQLRELPEGLIDPFLKTITFARGARPLARLHFYATHPQSFYGDPRVSIDTVGMAREELEREEGVFQVYFTGCAGDVAMGKYNDGSPEARTELTGRLKAGMRAAIAATRFAPVARPEWLVAPLQLTPKTSGEFEPAALREMIGNQQQKSVNLRVRAARRLAAQPWIAKPIDLGSLRLGNVRMLFLPGEPMVEFQLFAQRQRPDEFVAVAGYGDGCTSYLCTDEAYRQGGYEPGASAVESGGEAAFKAAVRRLCGLPQQP